MMDDEDSADFGFIPSGRSLLPNLFSSLGGGEENVNQALTYVAPKQPKQGDTQAKSNKSMKLIHSISAHAYKLENGKYESKGTLGAAILGSHEAALYKLLLYKGKQQHITWCTINGSFVFHIELNNYVMFRDDKDESWSLMFNSDTAVIDFAKQVALAKANSLGKNISTVIIQDLIPGEGAGLESGDSVEVTYTGWLLTNYAFGEVFDSNISSSKPLRFKLGSNKMIKGWSEGLIGARKGTRRLLIIPPSLGYGSDGMPNKIPPNAVLIFEIFINKVKLSSDSSHSPSPNKVTSEKKPDVPSRKSTLSNDESIIRARGASLSEQLGQSPQRDKAKLISRMAKMGQATLPIQGLTAAQTSSESETEKEIDHEQLNSPRTKSIPPSPQHLKQQVQKDVSNQPNVPSIKELISTPQQFSQVQREMEYSDKGYIQNMISSPRTSSPQIQMQGDQLLREVLPDFDIGESMCATTYSSFPTPVPNNSYPILQQAFSTPSMPVIMPSTVASVMDTHLPLLVAETRSQNTDVRLGLNRISDKVDTVLQKLDDVRLQQSSVSMMSQAPYMESSILAQNIERIIQENTRLKQDNELKNKKIQELNEKICDILQKNQRFFTESSTVLEQKSDSLQSHVLQLQEKLSLLEKEKEVLFKEFNEINLKLKNSLVEIENYKKLEKDMQEKLETSENEYQESKSIITSLKNLCTEKEIALTSLRENLEEVKQQNSKLLLQLNSVEEKLIESEKAAELLRKDEVEETEKSAVLEELKQLQEELQKALMWKKKYETVLENTRKLKSHYENEISQLVTQLKEQKNVRLNSPVSQDVSSQIKRAMNALYKSMQAKVETSHMYSGSEILQLCLNIIRGVTLSLLEANQGEDSKNQENKESKSSEEQPSAVPRADKTNSFTSSNSNVQPISDGEPSDKTLSSISHTQDIVSNSAVFVSNPDVDDHVAAGGDKVTVQNEILHENQLRETNKQLETGDCKSDSFLDVEEYKEKNVENLSNIDDVQPSRICDTTEADNIKRVESPAESVSSDQMWKPQPPPLFDDDDEEDEDDWLK